MRICRFDNDRLGIVEGGAVLDVSEALAAIPPQQWPYRHGDALIANLPAVLERAKSLAPQAPRRKLGEIRLRPPVALAILVFTAAVLAVATGVIMANNR